jgi:hypothetical protein
MRCHQVILTRSVPARLLLPLAAFTGIGLAVIPADFHAISNVKVTVAKPAQSFNAAF